jgi:hypothetical protein
MASFNSGSGAPPNNAADDLRNDMTFLSEGADDNAPVDVDDSPDGSEDDPDVGKKTPKKDKTPGERDPDVEEREEEKEDEGEDSEEDEEKAESEEEEEPTVQPIHARPTVRDITSKYPNFFKEFPDMRHVLFREGEYAKVFPTVDDARSAADAAESFNNFAELLNSGKAEDFQQFLGGIKEEGALDKMAANFLPSLYELDQKTYFKITSPIGEALVRNAYATASQSGNENLKNAALHLAQWAFGDQKFATGERKSEPFKVEEKKVDPEFEAERQKFYQDRYNDARQYVTGTSHSRLSAEIRKGLDPNGVFSDGLRTLLVKEVISEIGKSLEADERHMGVMNSLWKNAHKAGFSGDWKDRILSAYLSRARQLMPAIRTKIREAAMTSEERKAGQREQRAERSSDRREVRGTKESHGPAKGGRPPAASQVDWSKTSDLDFLNDKVTLRK